MIGARTRAALRQWQASRGEAVTGYLDVESAKLLLAAGPRESARREAEARQKWEKLGLVMVRVDGGSFTMGCQWVRDGNCFDDEEPAHRVQVRGFEIGKYEVTQELWEAVMGDNPSRFRGCDRCPVEQVGWDDVQAFLGRLNNLTGERYRLPSEAEWEYAARGGRQSRGYRYAGGNDAGSVGWYRDNSGRRTHAVGGKRANELGLHDMSGNVWEWAQDCWNDSYGDAPKDGRAWERGGCNLRVVRGGSWYFRPGYLRAANRSRDSTGSAAATSVSELPGRLCLESLPSLPRRARGLRPLGRNFQVFLCEAMRNAGGRPSCRTGQAIRQLSRQGGFVDLPGPEDGDDRIALEAIVQGLGVSTSWKYSWRHYS